MSDKVCKLCGITDKQLKTEGTHRRSNHWRHYEDGSSTWVEVKKSCKNPDSKKIEEHHYSYFPEKTINLCTKCHSSVHNDDLFIGTIYSPPAGHSRLFYDENIMYDEDKNDGLGRFINPPNITVSVDCEYPGCEGCYMHYSYGMYRNGPCVSLYLKDGKCFKRECVGGEIPFVEHICMGFRIYHCDLLEETDKAYLLYIYDFDSYILIGDFWLPKSKIEISNDEKRVVIPIWLISKKDIPPSLKQEKDILKKDKKVKEVGMMGFKACKLCGITDKQLKSEGTHNRSNHWRDYKDGTRTWVRVENPCNNPNKRKIEEHHYSYFPEKKVNLCTKCHSSVHNDDLFIGTIYSPPAGHSCLFYDDNIIYDQSKNDGIGGFVLIDNIKIVKIPRLWEVIDIKSEKCPNCSTVINTENSRCEKCNLLFSGGLSHKIDDEVLKEILKNQSKGLKANKVRNND